MDLIVCSTCSTASGNSALHYAGVSKQRVPLAFDQIKYDPTFKGINSLIF
jgi:hypothetical protein